MITIFETSRLLVRELSPDDVGEIGNGQYAFEGLSPPSPYVVTIVFITADDWQQ